MAGYAPWRQRLKVADEMSPGGLRAYHESLPDSLLNMSADDGVSYGDNLSQEANAALEHSEYFDVRSGDRLRRTAAALQDPRICRSPHAGRVRTGSRWHGHGADRSRSSTAGTSCEYAPHRSAAPCMPALPKTSQPIRPIFRSRYSSLARVKPRLRAAAETLPPARRRASA